MVEITSREELQAWLADKPTDWGQVIAARAALRVLPYAFSGIAVRELVEELAYPLLWALYTSWAALNFPAHDMAAAVALAQDYAADSAFVASSEYADNSNYADAAIHATYAAIETNDVSSAAMAARIFATAEAAAIDNFVGHAKADADATAAFWANVSSDCGKLETNANPATGSRLMTNKALWPAKPPTGWWDAWVGSTLRLCQLGQGFPVWIDWYERRIRGEDAAFDIPGDKGRKEDKAILARLADATDEDFWGKGAAYVNTTLQGWIDEARARVAPQMEPPQEPGATAYGINVAGKIDRLPPADQQHLRDNPDQQIIYRDVRATALDLAQEGQRLGARLGKALAQFITSMPELFGDAEAYPIWRDGNTLRRIHRAHRAVAGGRDPDEARLEPAVAEMLGDVLDRYNLFAFGDDGLRAKDEKSIPPQERAAAEREAAAFSPIIAAILAAPEIATDVALDDIRADDIAETLPADDPYAAQVLDQANRTRRNWIAALLGGAGKFLKWSGRELASGVLRGVGVAAVTDTSGETHILSGLAKFVIENAATLRTYAETAFPNIIQRLWDMIAALRSQ